MSALLIDTPPVETASTGMGTDASQLFFDFEPPTGNVPASGAENVRGEAFAPSAERSAGSTEPGLETSPQIGTLSKPGDLEQTEVISSAGRRRSIGQPVRIGTVMLKLLKSYGITDEEIQAGLTDFANRQISQRQVLANAS